MNGHAILCRYGELFLKGLNRAHFERKLADHIRRVLVENPGKLERLHGRMLVWPDEGTSPERLLAALARVFGLTSLSPVRVLAHDMPAITQAALEEVRLASAGALRPPRFRVEARRADKRFPLSSPEIGRDVGAAIFEGLGLPVDLHHPELTVGVEIGFEHAFVYARTIAGPGGLPLGTAGKVDLLLSGGIDSPVAGYLMMKRGCLIAATYFHSFPYTGDRTKEKLLSLARHLARWQGELELRVVPFTAAQTALRDAGDRRFAVVLYRRMMMRVASRLAEERGAQALVTGEALGQVASQTLDNLRTIEESAGLPVLRPLIAHDKQETIAWARRLGSYDISIQPYEDACSMFVPEHPEIHARLREIQAIEHHLDVEALVRGCLEGVERIRCTPA